jgi:hypothetical protein
MNTALVHSLHTKWFNFSLNRSAMEAIKKARIKRSGNKLIVTLPDSFVAEEVDVLIWPSNEEQGPTQNSLSDDLLQWAEMTDEELSAITEKKQHLNAWK